MCVCVFRELKRKMEKGSVDVTMVTAVTAARSVPVVFMTMALCVWCVTEHAGMVVVEEVREIVRSVPLVM